MGLLYLDLNISLFYPLRIASLPRFQGGPLSDTNQNGTNQNLVDSAQPTVARIKMASLSGMVPNY